MLNDSSIGLRSGEYEGRYMRRQPIDMVSNVPNYVHRIQTGPMNQINQSVIVVDATIIDNEDALVVGPRIHLR